MRTDNRDKLNRAIGMLIAIEFLAEQDGIGEVAGETKDLIEDVLDTEAIEEDGA